MANVIPMQDIRKLPLPEGWFISEEEAQGSLTNYKGWVYRKVKNHNEIPHFIFPV